MLIDEVILAVVHILLCEHFTVNALILQLLFVSVLKTMLWWKILTYFFVNMWKHFSRQYAGEHEGACMSPTYLDVAALSSKDLCQCELLSAGSDSCCSSLFLIPGIGNSFSFCLFDGYEINYYNLDVWRYCRSLSNNVKQDWRFLLSSQV